MRRLPKTRLRDYIARNRAKHHLGNYGTKAMDTTLPLSLQILRTVQSFGTIPRGLLHDKLSASSTEIDQRVTELVKEGVVKVHKGKDLIIAT